MYIYIYTHLYMLEMQTQNMTKHINTSRPVRALCSAASLSLLPNNVTSPPASACTLVSTDRASARRDVWVAFFVRGRGVGGLWV